MWPLQHLAKAEGNNVGSGAVKDPKRDRQLLAGTGSLEHLIVAGREGNGLDGPRGPSRSKGVAKEQEPWGQKD